MNKLKTNPARICLGFGGFAVAVALSIVSQATPALANSGTPNVTISVPGAGDTNAPRTLKETTTAIANGILAHVARIDDERANYAACVEEAARKYGLDAQTQKRACEVAQSSAKISLIGEIQADWGEYASEFYAMGENIQFQIETSKKAAVDYKRKADEYSAAIRELLADAKKFHAGFDPANATRQEEAQMSELVVALKTAEFQQQRAETKRAREERTIAFLQTSKERFLDWGAHFEASARELEIPMLHEQAYIEDIKNKADWEAMVSASSGLPADLGTIGVALTDIGAHMREEKEHSAEEIQIGSPELPAPGSSSSHAYNALADFFARYEEGAK